MSCAVEIVGERKQQKENLRCQLGLNRIISFSFQLLHPPLLLPLVVMQKSDCGCQSEMAALLRTAVGYRNPGATTNCLVVLLVACVPLWNNCKMLNLGSTKFTNNNNNNSVRDAAVEWNSKKPPEPSHLSFVLRVPFLTDSLTLSLSPSLTHVGECSWQTHAAATTTRCVHDCNYYRASSCVGQQLSQPEDSN